MTGDKATNIDGAPGADGGSAASPAGPVSAGGAVSTAGPAGAASPASPTSAASPASPTSAASPAEQLLETLKDAAATAEADEADSLKIATPAGGNDGVNKCPQCGGSDVAFVTSRTALVCRFCRYEWQPESLDEALGLSENIGRLKGTITSTNAADIEDDAALVTLKCAGCGAEVVIDTDHNLKARCHWCKSVLSLNNRIANGAVPDGILPFRISKEEAMASIKAFADERKRFALPAFAESFKPENIMGVYLPYMTVDGNIKTRFDGFGEITVSSRRINDNETEYTVNSFKLGLDLDLEVDDLVVETASSKANINSEVSTNNIINALLPYDVKKVVRFNANYLGEEFTSERRDLDIDEVEHFAAQHFLTIARSAGMPSIRKFSRGVRWDAEAIHIHGSRWTSVLLPVWLYVYVETRRGRQITHYIAVNGRTGYTMGSVPINWAKARAVSWATAIGISIVAWPIAIWLAIADMSS